MAGDQEKDLSNQQVLETNKTMDREVSVGYDVRRPKSESAKDPLAVALTPDRLAPRGTPSLD